MAGKQQQGGGGGDNSLDFLWLIVLIVGIGYATWFFGQDIIAGFVYTVRYYEILFLDLIAQGWHWLTSWSSAPDIDITPLRYWVAVVNRGIGSSDFSALAEISTDVGLYYRHPMALILAGLAASLYFGSASSRFNATQSMKTLLKSEEAIWHGVSPVVGLKILKEKLDEGKWRMGQTPMLFVKTHDLAIEIVKDRKTVLELVPGRAKNMFVKQLGGLWESAHHLPIYMQALFVIFGARAMGERKLADKMLEQISYSARRGRLDFSGAKLALIKLRNCNLITKVVYRHAYVMTVMAAMLELARCDGVLATSEFIWLKPLDRRLWYVLNDVGRQTSSVESSGVFAHLAAERKFGRPLRVPMVDEAVVALEEALEEILYEPEDS